MADEPAWAQFLHELDRLVRAFNPWPIAETRWNGQQLRVWEATPLDKKSSAAPGAVIATDGDADVATELWCINYQAWCDEEGAAGNVLITETSMFDSAEQGWYVPRYVIEGDEERGIEPSAPDLQVAR
jgi:hypothetical protein